MVIGFGAGVGITATIAAMGIASRASLSGLAVADVATTIGAIVAGSI
jgi:hypothetical protein